MAVDSISVNPTVGQRGTKVFRAFIRSTDKEWLSVTPTRSGDHYLAIPNDAVIDIDSTDERAPALITINASATVYDVRERAMPASDIEPATSDDPDVLYLRINPWRQFALLLQLQASGRSLTVGDLTDDELDDIIAGLEEWYRRWQRRHADE